MHSSQREERNEAYQTLGYHKTYSHYCICPRASSSAVTENTERLRALQTPQPNEELDTCGARNAGAVWKHGSRSLKQKGPNERTAEERETRATR